MLDLHKDNNSIIPVFRDDDTFETHNNNNNYGLNIIFCRETVAAAKYKSA